MHDMGFYQLDMLLLYFCMAAACFSCPCYCMGLILQLSAYFDWFSGHRPRLFGGFHDMFLSVL